MRVWKDGPLGIWWWQCRAEKCKWPANKGCSIHWEVCQHLADEHVREHHRPVKKLSRDSQTPPGGSHFDWSDTGMHVRIREDD